MLGQEFAFWHPVGAHAGEELQEILRRKQKDINQFGYTVWSFTAAKLSRVRQWQAEMKRVNQNTATAYCCGDSTKDPGKGKPSHWMCQSTEDQRNWKSLPSNKMTSYHKGPRKDGIVASAFIVTGISAPVGKRILRPTDWLRTSSSTWETKKGVPTRGEYLIRVPEVSNMGRLVRVELKLQAPFVVWVA